MSAIEFEAWLGQSEPYEISTPIFETTKTQINFTVIDSARVAMDLSNYAYQFAVRSVEDTSTLFDVACTDVNEASGKIKADLTVIHTASAAECLGELRLYSGGDASGDCTDRIQFRLDIIEKVG